MPDNGLMSDYQKLSELQDLFKCRRCGNCCSVGGDMKMGTMSYLKLEEGGFMDGDVQIEVAASNVDGLPTEFRFCKTKPCALYDPEDCTCKAQRYKPIECERFPFLLLFDKGCTFEALFVCPGALQALSEYFGRPMDEVRVQVC